MSPLTIWTGIKALATLKGLKDSYDRFKAWQKEKDSKTPPTNTAMVIIAAMLLTGASCPTTKDLRDLSEFCAQFPSEPICEYAPKLPTPTATVQPTAATPTPDPLPNPSPSSSPAPTSTTSPTSAPGPAWVTRVKRVNGFGNCSPREAGKGRTEATCRGDRTYHYEMPSEQIVPKYAGMSCEPQTANRWFRTEGFVMHDGYTCGKFDQVKVGGVERCLCRDDAQSPCGGAPVCESGRYDRCERLRVGCNDMEWDDPRGSILSVTGDGVECRDIDGFALACNGTVGATYMLCARLYPDARTADDREIEHSGNNSANFCKAGIW
jgi:hypothetical protein